MAELFKPRGLKERRSFGAMGRIRQIEAKALEKIRQHGKSHKLKGY